MRASFKLLALAAGLTVAASAPALSPVSAVPPIPPIPPVPPAPPAPILGTWAVDVSQLPIPADQRPRSVTISFIDVGGGKWQTNVDIVAPDGSATHGVTTYIPNGTPAPAEGTAEADMVAITTPKPDVLVMALSKGGVPGSIRIFTVAPDGKSLTETAVYFGRDGKPVMRPAYMSRIR